MGKGMEWKAIRRGESNEGIRGAYSEPQETEDVSEFLEGDGSEIEKLIDGIDTSMDEEGTPKAEEKSEKKRRDRRRSRRKRRRRPNAPPRSPAVPSLRRRSKNAPGPPFTRPKIG